MPAHHLITAFLEDLPFDPDPFQVEALRSFADGNSVVVTAPTGSGKTVVAEGAIEMVIATGQRAFYTTPIKALSNQKFNDLRETYGDGAVGLLTGDNVINGDASIVVMTTEVLRNMIYQDSLALKRLGVVILDEVHYLADRSRGSVWEEVIIHLPRTIPLVCLSATIANPEEFTEWIRSRRGPTDLVVEHTRPVPLTTMFMWRDRYKGGSSVMLPMFVRNGKPNPAIAKLVHSSRNRHRRLSTPRRTEVVEHLVELGLLPAIYFVFSRQGCDQTAQQIAQAGFPLTTAAEREEIRAVVERRTGHLGAQDLAVLGYAGWLAMLERGAGAHHAGLVPAFKETVEELFLRGLVKVVAATETLALGINMPARTVVLDSLSKFTGEGHELLQPSDFTQLTGRAGRRGMDREGTAVVLYSPYIPFDRVSAIAGTGANPLRSSFSPTYNMAVNLIAKYRESEATDLLAASFANFSRGARTEQLAETLAGLQSDLATFREAAACERGDIWEVVGDARRPATPALDRTSLMPGTVVSLGSETLLLANRSWGGGQPRLVMIDATGRRSSVRSTDLPRSALVVGVLAMPQPVRVSDAAYRSEVAAMLEAFVPDQDPRPLYVDAETDGVLGCPDLDAHLAWAQRARRTQRDIERLERRLARTGPDDVVARFGALHRVLEKFGYVDGWALTDRGASLRTLYNELDLLLAESIRTGVFDGLDPAQFAAAVSLFTFETRGKDVPPPPHAPFIHEIVERVDTLHDEIIATEQANGIDEQRRVDAGLVDAIHAWASGHDLADVFEDDDVRAGDFVRESRQLLDLLRQIRDGFDAHRSIAGEAIRMIDRGIVAVEVLR